MKVKDVRKMFIEKYKNHEFLEVRGFKTIELINISFEADEEFIFKRPNYDYIRKEIKWYLSQSLNIYDLDPNPPKAWVMSADKHGNINSNYGYIVFSEKFHNQFKQAKKHLEQDLYTRRAVLIYNRPSMHLEWNEGGKNDFVCTMYQQFLYRDGELHLIVSMRSNDAVYGYRNDRAWALFLLDKMASALGVDPGKIYWHCGSLHIYEQHFVEIEKWIKGGEQDEA